MDEMTKKFTEEEIKRIGETDDFHIAPLREDGQTYGTLTWIWAVEVDGNLYVRAYSGKKSSWYKAAVKQKVGKIKAAGIERKVRFETETDLETNKRIDEAYKKKYKGDEYLESMIGNGPKSATIKITSFE